MIYPASYAAVFGHYVGLLGAVFDLICNRVFLFRKFCLKLPDSEPLGEMAPILTAASHFVRNDPNFSESC